MKLETEVKALLKKGQRKKAKHKVASVKRLKQQQAKKEGAVGLLEKTKMSLEQGEDNKTMVETLAMANKIMQE